VSQRTLERKPEGMKPYIFAVGGGSLFAIHNECEVYNPKTNQWAQISPMISRRSRAGVAALTKMLYVCGGYDGMVIRKFNAQQLSLLLSSTQVKMISRQLNAIIHSLMNGNK